MKEVVKTGLTYSVSMLAGSASMVVLAMLAKWVVV